MAGRPIWIARFGLLRDRESAEVTFRYLGIAHFLNQGRKAQEDFNGSLYRGHIVTCFGPCSAYLASTFTKVPSPAFVSCGITIPNASYAFLSSL